MTNQTRSPVHDAATKAETLAYNLASASSLASVLSEVLKKEIGGTIGDIESLPFIEAARQFMRERPADDVCFVHVTLVPYIAAAHEVKTKPTQHSVK